MTDDKLVHVPPEQVLADDNSRFNLKRTRIDSLAANILETNGVLTPVEAEVLAPPQNGYKYRLTSGFYRHAAVSKLNAEQQAGLLLPVILRDTSDELGRLKHQLAENMERENQSPMDRAVAIKKLLDAGVARGEVRRIFSTTGGRKGNQVQPLSNAMLNITLRFLELPKAIQEKIHDGRVGVAAAYELGKVPPDKRQQVLERAEADRLSQIEREEKDEERYLGAEKRVAEAEKKTQEVTSKIDQTKAEIVAATALVRDKEKVLRDIQKEPYLEMDAAAKKNLTERNNAGMVDLKAAQKLERAAKNLLAKLLGQAKAAVETVAEKKAHLEAARKAIKPAVKGDKKANKAVVGPGDIARAAQAEGTHTGYVPLTLADIRAAVREVADNKDYPRVAAIGKVFKDCFDGKETPKGVMHLIGVMTGEVAAPQRTAKPVRQAAAPIQ